MALVYDGGVLIGADTRTSAGILISNKVSDKLEPLHQRIWCQRCGTSSHTETIAKVTRYYLDIHASELGDLPLVETAGNLIQDLLYKNPSLSGALIVSGWDKVHGPQIFNV